MFNGRALHYVFKIGDRNLSAHFYRNILGMKVLRHEEFTEGCDAACNGPYDNRWSKTMIGYGPEDTHFVLELTYNYPVKSYDKGNDFIGVTIKSREVLEKAKEHNWPILEGNVLEAPGGYQFYIVDEPQPDDKDPVESVTLSSSNLNNTINYWNKLLGLNIYKRDEKSVTLGFKNDETKLIFKQIDDPINRAQAYGRVAFSVPFEEQEIINEKIKNSGEMILTPLISLDTPGKATVRVIILGDPDGHEICFVDDESFRNLSAIDPNANNLLDGYINRDKS